MIAFKYTKVDGAEYLSHLDLLRHINRTLKRAGVQVAVSEGFHAHPKLFLNNPLPVGVQSVAEYGAVEVLNCGGEEDFTALFNEHSPAGIKCIKYIKTQINPNYAANIDSCSYIATGISPFNPVDILAQKSIIIEDTRGRSTDIRPKILSLSCEDTGVYFTLSCGNSNLRPDLFINYICSLYGTDAEKILKLSAHGANVF